MGQRRRLAVVSYFARRPYEPRGIRTRSIIHALAPEWEIDLIAGPHEVIGSSSSLRRAARFARYHIVRAFALDLAEPWSRRTLRVWPASVEGALLVGFPFSPVVEAARRLHHLGVPFVIDASDPWAITAAKRDMGAIASRRARSEEQLMWERATGAVLTTSQQQRRLLERFPHLQTLVRPNGFQEARSPAPPPVSATDRVLRIGHFGNLYAPRVDVRPFFMQLCRSDHWDGVVLEQFGGDWNHTVQRLPPSLEVRVHDPVPWAEVINVSCALDIALVIGNVGGIQLPSKVIDYLTLPIPRMAVLANPPDDAISEYVSDKPGWLVIGARDNDAADRIAAHVARPWNAGSLAPPPGESWTAVGRQIASFVSTCVRKADRSNQ